MRPKKARKRHRRRGKGKARTYAHVRRAKDAAEADDAHILDVTQVGMLQGVPFTYRWLQNPGGMARTVAGKIIGNAVPPAMMAAVGRWLVAAKREPEAWDNADERGGAQSTPLDSANVNPPIVLPHVVLEAQNMAIHALLAMRHVYKDTVCVVGSWFRAALSSATTHSVGKQVLPSWALDSPRQIQSPLLAE